MFKEGSANPQLAKAWQQMPARVNQVAILTHPVDIHAEQLALTAAPGTIRVQWQEVGDFRA